MKNKILLLLVSLLSLGLPQRGLAARPPTVVAAFNAAAMDFPESIAVDSQGNVYLSMPFNLTVKKVTPAGVVSVFVTISDDYIQGVKFDAADNLFIVGGSGVWKVTPAGAASLFAAIPGDSCNDLALDGRGNIYVTDNATDHVWKVDATGRATVWSTAAELAGRQSFMPFPIGNNGLAVDTQNKTLYVTVTSAGRIVAIPINTDGSAGTARLVVEDDALIGADGVIIDSRGNFIVSVNLLNRISRVAPNGKISDIAAGGPLSFPCATALDTRNGRTTLYVCNNGNAFFGTTQHDQALLKIDNLDDAKLLNLSARANVSSGESVTIGGFVIDGPTSKRVLIRGVGPSLSGFGVTRPLTDPILNLFRGATLQATNDNWGGDAAIASAATAAGAFPLPAGSKDAALLVTLPPGSYTAMVDTANAGTGVALVEIYEVP